MEHLTGPCDFREGIIPSIFTYIFFLFWFDLVWLRRFDFLFWGVVFWSGSCYVAQAGLELTVLLPSNSVVLGIQTWLILLSSL
jgi:hypothetical protein